MAWRDLINSLISDNMLSINAFAKKCYLHHTTVLNLLSDKTSAVQLRTKSNIEKAFRIKIDDSDPNNLIVTASPSSRSIVDMTNELIERRSPVRGNYILGTVTAGRGAVVNYETAQVNVLDYPSESCFWFNLDKQNGDSMYPMLTENDRVLVDMQFPRKQIKEYDIVMVVYQDRGSIKFFSRSDDDANILIFYSSNNLVAPIILRKENCEYFKVVLIQKI
jgi:hypothetical protein